MSNNYEFWENYLKRIKSQILKLCEEKEELKIDLHIHSNYSADGKQSVEEIIKSTKSKGFDIIAITDHDSLNAYNELYCYIQSGLTNPIVIPGIEFTVDCKEYGSQCHMLQLFVNPKDKNLDKNVEQNYNSSFNRSKIQFQRLKENLAIQEILKRNNIKISYEEYCKYLNLNDLIAEYDTLCEYLISKFRQKNVTTFDVFKLLIKYNEDDCYPDRKEFKRKRYEVLKEKYKFQKENFYNVRFLLSLLAVREVDDDWWEAPSSGSLSVNSYGQLKIHEINDKYPIYFAHPTEGKLDFVESILKTHENIVGLEANFRNQYKDKSKFNQLLEDYCLYMVKGSDSHDSTLQFYQDMDFYKIKSSEMKEIID